MQETAPLANDDNDLLDLYPAIFPTAQVTLQWDTYSFYPTTTTHEVTICVEKE